MPEAISPPAIGRRTILSNFLAPRHPTIPSRIRPEPGARGAWVAITCAITLAIAVRAFVLFRARGMMDGDEALLGLQAEHILRGELPIYLYGQPYMGTFEAYLAAPFVALLGPSGTTLHIAALIESLVALVLLGALARRLYGVRAQVYALLLAALAPLYVTVGELHLWGGYEPTLILGTALMLLATSIADGWASGRSTRRSWAWVGLVLGLGFWIDPIIVYYLIAVALWLAPFALDQVRRGIALRATVLNGALAGCLAALGFLPALIYAFTTHYANIKFILRSNGSVGQFGGPAVHANAADPLRLGQMGFFWLNLVPRLSGSQLLWGGFLPGFLANVVAVLVVYALLYGLLGPAVRLATARPTLSSRTFRWAWNRVLPVLLLLVIALIYAWSAYANAYVLDFDLTGRYVLPATTGLSLALAGALADLPVVLARLSRALRGAQLRPLWRAVAPALVGVLLVSYALPYFTANVVVAMQSPYRQRDLYPAVDGQMLAYLEQHHIRSIWTIHWLGNVVLFQSDEHIIAGDMAFHDRFPQNTQTLLQADRPTYVIEADPANGECAVARALDQMGVSYTAVPFTHWWLITPTSRNVSPVELRQAIAPDYDR